MCGSRVSLLLKPFTCLAVLQLGTGDHRSNGVVQSVEVSTNFEVNSHKHLQLWHLLSGSSIKGSTSDVSNI